MYSMSRIVIMLVTCAKNRKTRAEYMEQLWLSNQPHPYVIIMGRGAEHTMQCNDVILPVDDTYSGLVDKVIEGFRYILLHIQCDAILKIDDDVIPNSNTFLTYMQNTHYDYEGKLHKKGCAGPVYFVSKIAASVIVSNTSVSKELSLAPSNKGGYVHCEDIHVGNVLSYHNILPREICPMYIDILTIGNGFVVDKSKVTLNFSSIRNAPFYHIVNFEKEQSSLHHLDAAVQCKWRNYSGGVNTSAK